MLEGTGLLPLTKVRMSGQAMGLRPEEENLECVVALLCQGRQPEGARVLLGKDLFGGDTGFATQL